MSDPVITAIDFETYYSKQVSITVQGLDNYMDHPEFDAYLLSVASSDGTVWVGHPGEFDWASIDGHVLLSHNASFDEAVYRWLVARGKVPQIAPMAWYCTADMAAYIGSPRSLDKAASLILKRDISKEVRNKMCGKRWEDMTPEFRQEVLQYASLDAEICLQLWTTAQHLWPEDERELSLLTRQMQWHGVRIDAEGLRKDAANLEQLRDDLERKIPWVPEQKPLSRKALVAWLTERNIPLPVIRISDEDAAHDSTILREGKEPAAVPFQDPREKEVLQEKVTFRKDDEMVKEWISANPEAGDLMRTIWGFRSSNALAKKLKSMLIRQRKSDERMGFGLFYFGAHTGRDTGGGGGVNMQNLPKKRMFADEFRAVSWEQSESEQEEQELDSDGEEFGVSLRGRIIASPGHVILAGDLAAIEPRALAFLAGDKESLDAARVTSDWYEARARAWGLYTNPLPLKEGDPKLRDLIKQLEIGLGYGMGVSTYQKKTGVSAERAGENWLNYRRWNPKVVDFWNMLRTSIRTHERGDTLKVRLPSGRVQQFRKIQRQEIHRKDEMPRIVHTFLRLSPSGYIRQKFHAGFATENLVQAFARDIYMDRVLAVARAGFRIVLRVHDEIVCEVPEDQAEPMAAKLKEVMTTSPAWAKSLPLAAGVNWGRTYAEAK